MFYRTFYTSDVKEKNLGQKLQLSGWVHRCRDHGGVIFVDLRDMHGFCQLVINPDDNKSIFTLAEGLRAEFVIQVEGVCQLRPQGTENQGLSTGEYELRVENLVILSKSLPLPFPIDEQSSTQSGEEVRLQYRFLDLRRESIKNMLKCRAQVMSVLRSFLEKNDFLEIETPVLTKPTPEGAREYLVPSRTQSGYGFALQQSPQQFKQILVMGGVEKYYQVVKCFRDEDLRADRQPEFTQLDIEMAFVDQKDVITLAGDAIKAVFSQVFKEDLGEIPTMRFQEAMQRYGTDKPDLRNPLFLVPLESVCKDCGFDVFKVPAERPDHRVVAMRVPGGTQLSRKQIDDYTQLVGRHGAKGLAYIKINHTKDHSGLQSPIVKFLQPEIIDRILELCEVKEGDLLFFGAGPDKVVNQSMDILRRTIAEDLSLLCKKWAPVWIVDFPLFEKDETIVGKTVWKSCHHPFTAPKAQSIDDLRTNYAEMTAKAYDLVLNGFEIAGGSCRIHDYKMQLAAFKTLGLDLDKANEKFGHLLQALQYGAPPHAGIAFGMDRLMMLLLEKSSIREVIAFPKTQNASCPLTKAPSALDVAALKELGLKRTHALDTEKTG
ncbi:MAG: aspartate--tRNA ligase [Pseudomonadota bacterium]|nr:aspartate--tRNA ligase [Pseudomonadota bacterium]